ncbi:MAG TPA: long-chain-fatty-acid--CoA ligase [Rhizomicrobium sp.]|nr:long-chain-fatty-acid--CoA ligase [Rhizomicrobium sp.]
MRGLMQDWPMLVHRLIDHAALYHQGASIVSRTVEGDMHRTGYAEIRARARKLSRALTKRGIRPGDRVATLAWNTYRHVECWYGIAGMGAVYHTLNPRLFADQIAWITNHGGARALFYDNCFAPIVEAIAPKLRHVEFFVALGDEIAPIKLRKKPLVYEKLIAGPSSGNKGDFDWPALDENSACGLCYTSGTTGDPKGVLYSHRSNILTALLAGQSPGLHMGPMDRMLPVVPMFHANGWAIPFLTALSGASLVMPGPRLDGASIYQLLEEERVTITAAVPTVWMNLLQYLEDNRLKLSHLKRVCIGGAAAPRALVEQFEDKFGVEVIHAWGMTEMSPIGTMSAIKPPLDVLPRARQLDIKAKQGYPHFGIEMKITDDKGHARPRDGKAFGRLKVKGPNIARAYFKGAGREAFGKDGWFDTGDVATLDEYGYMQITDRSKDVIKSGGEWISTIEIENLAVGHPDVAEAAVIGIPHPKWNERPLLIVVPRPGTAPNVEALLAHLRGRIAKWWLPDAVVFVDDIPHTATGKILKTELRRRFVDFKFTS